VQVLWFTRRTGSSFVRLAALVGVLVLVCVPSLTRAGQKLETSSLAPTFRNVDCPPKKVTVAPVQAVFTAAATVLSEALPAVRIVAPASVAPPRAVALSAPRALRAPPSVFLA
jgi:hypothetical protein